MASGIEQIIVALATAELNNAFGADVPPKAKAKVAEQHQKMAAVIGKVASAVIDWINSGGTVMPAIPTAGSPAAQATTLPGKIQVP